jgi:hypothetical protein
VPDRELADGGRSGSLSALEVGIGAALVRADEVGGRDPLPRGGRHRGAEDGGGLRAEALVGSADELGVGDVVQEAIVERGGVAGVDADRPVRLRDDGHGVGTGADGGQVLADGGEERRDVDEVTDRGMLAGLRGDHPAVGTRDEDRRSIGIQHGRRRRGVLVQPGARPGRRDSRFSARRKRHRGARDPAAMEQLGRRREPPRPVAGERSMDEHDPHGEHVTRSAGWLRAGGRGRRWRLR